VRRSSSILFLIVSVAISINGCTQTTYVRAENSSGYGYWDKNLEGNEYLVGFRGNSVTVKERVLYFARFRAAQYGLNRGYNFFKWQLDDINSTELGAPNGNEHSVYRGTEFDDSLQIHSVVLRCHGYKERPDQDAIEISGFLEKHPIE
jgi:hypothetical protein